MSTPVHPGEALFKGEKPFPIIPSCEHYPGSEKLMFRALELKDTAVVHNDARRTRNEFGFLRMWSIYPAQIQPIADAMKPDHSEVENGAAILLAAQKTDWGPIQYAGELHDRATYRYYWELLQKAKVTGVAIPSEADKAFFS